MTYFARIFLCCCAIAVPSFVVGAEQQPDVVSQFVTPPDAARPWVYWYFMDGNMSREGLTADLEAMKQAGIGGAIFLEVNLGIPRARAIHEHDVARIVSTCGERGRATGTGDRGRNRPRLVRHRRTVVQAGARHATLGGQ